MQISRLIEMIHILLGKRAVTAAELAEQGEGVYYATVTAVVGGAYTEPSLEYVDEYVAGYQMPYDRMSTVTNVKWEGTVLHWDKKPYFTAEQICTILLSQLIGGLLPVAAEKLHVDPAVMASPLITTIVDTTTLLIYFNIAKMLLHL